MFNRGFIKLLIRYRAGTLPNRVKEVMDVWYHTLHKNPVETNTKQEIGERIWTGIVLEKENITPHPSLRKNYRWIWKAAVVLLMAGTAYFYFDKQATDQASAYPAMAQADLPLIEVNNTSKRTKDLTLQDGSKVKLEPGGKLWYPQKFDAQTRTVYLEGNGFFDVTKDAKKPFLVYSGAVLTRVLGTSFRIKAIAKTGGTEVAVVTGKVIVEKVNLSTQPNYGAESKSRVVLTPNKKVTFFQSSDHYITGLIENPVIIANQEEFLKPGAFDFDETSLMDVIEKLEKAYGVEITISNDGTMGCPITADLTADSLLGKIEIIAAVLDAKYEITGSSILLSGGKCGVAKFKP